MVLRMTGASWLATMMRSGRDDADRPAPPPAWLLDAPAEPELVEALERLAANDAH